MWRVLLVIDAGNVARVVHVCHIFLSVLIAFVFFLMVLSGFTPTCIVPRRRCPPRGQRLRGDIH